MSKKSFTISVLTTAIVAGAFVMPAHAEWTGGDGQSTNPLACGGAQTPTPVIAYDGGKVAQTSRKDGVPYQVVNIPKLIGIGYFDSAARGATKAAAALSGVNVTTDGPTQANIDDQITLIDNYITSGINGIVFSANDPVAIAPVLRKAMGAGINVVGYDSDADPDARQWFVSPAEFNGVAKSLMDELARGIGAEGSFAIVTSTFTTPNQARWISEMEAYQKACYPKMTWLETVEAQEDNILSFNQATTLINKYGDGLNGLIGMTSVATPAAAEAVTQAGLCGEVTVTGLATPNAIKPYIGADCVKSAVLWDTEAMGYAAVQALYAAENGKLTPGDTSFMAGELGDLKIVNGSQILLGAPTIFTADNIEKYDF